MFDQQTSDSAKALLVEINMRVQAGGQDIATELIRLMFDQGFINDARLKAAQARSNEISKNDKETAEKLSKESESANKAHLVSIAHYSILFRSRVLCPEPLNSWLQKLSAEELQKIMSEIKSNKLALRDYFQGNTDYAISLLQTEITRKNLIKELEKPKETQEQKDKKSLTEKLKAFVS